MSEVSLNVLLLYICFLVRICAGLYPCVPQVYAYANIYHTPRPRLSTSPFVFRNVLILFLSADKNSATTEHRVIELAVRSIV